jgi:hypothetical protein
VDLPKNGFGCESIGTVRFLGPVAKGTIPSGAGELAAAAAPLRLNASAEDICGVGTRSSKMTGSVI